MPTSSSDENERRFRRLVETLDHAVVWEFDDHAQQYTFVSQHSKLVLGYEAEDWLADGHFVEAHVHPVDEERVREAFRKLRQGELSDVRVEHRFLHADGRYIWVHSGVHCEQEEARAVFRGVTIDIEHLKQAEERQRIALVEAERAARARDEVLAVVAHDLRNPLNTVQLACESLDNPELLERNVKLIRRAVRQMGVLIDDLVDAASIRASRLRIERTEMDPVEVARNTVEDFAAEAAERGINLRFQGDVSVRVRADARRIAQALANLVNNALKFTDRDGTVTVKVKSDPLQVHFEVSDTGHGIPQHELDKVFDREWQSDATAHLGSGMGLYIAKGVVETHGGEIRVVSAHGQGSVFSFFLPR